MSNSRGKSVRLTTAQAVVTYLSRSTASPTGTPPAGPRRAGHLRARQRRRVGPGAGRAVGPDAVRPGPQRAVPRHIATGYGKATKRRATLAVTASIGPGALNLVTAAGLATVNRLPLLLLPGDTYATRRQGPVLQQLQHPIEADATVNDAFRPVSRFFDRITRPEQLLTALPHAMRVLTDPVDTGAVVLSLPQDVQSHAFDFPVEFFAGGTG